MHYRCGENKGADQLRGYREADLCLCFRICKKAGFLTLRLKLALLLLCQGFMSHQQLRSYGDETQV